MAAPPSRDKIGSSSGIEVTNMQLARAEENALAKIVLAHFEKELESTPVVDEPFQHFYTDNVWPADVYAQMLRFLPANDLYSPLNLKQWVNAKGVSTRDKCYLPEVIERMGPEQADFWRQIWLALTSDSLKRLLFRKLRKDIAIRLGKSPDDVEDTEVFVRISLARDIDDYRIKPHPDGRPHIVTAQFYLPVDSSRRDLGTSFYVERPLPQRLFGGRFKEVKRMAFLRNSAYGFAVNDIAGGPRSLHGRELLQPGSGIRDTIVVRWSIPVPARKHADEGVSPIHQLF
jgi:hypothetical protein